MFAGRLSGKNVITLTELFLEIHQNYAIHVLLKRWKGFVCNKYLKKSKMPIQGQNNNFQLCHRIEELDCSCPIELILISHHPIHI